MKWYDGLAPETKKIAIDILSHCHFTGELVDKVDPDCGCAVHRAWRTEVAEKDRTERIKAVEAANKQSADDRDRLAGAVEALERARVDADTSASAVGEAEARYLAAADEVDSLRRAYDTTVASWTRLKSDHRELLSRCDEEGNKLSEATAELKRVKDLASQIL